MSAEPSAVRVTRRVAVPPEQVSAAWLDHVTARLWLFATPDGAMLRAETDPRVGGGFAFVERRGEEEVAHVGEYVALEPPRRIAFDLSADGSPATRVEVTIAPAPEGAEVTVSHRLPPEQATWADATRAGWTMILDGMAKSLESAR